MLFPARSIIATHANVRLLEFWMRDAKDGAEWTACWSRYCEGQQKLQEQLQRIRAWLFAPGREYRALALRDLYGNQVDRPYRVWDEVQSELIAAQLLSPPEVPGAPRSTRHTRLGRIVWIELQEDLALLTTHLELETLRSSGEELH